MSLRRSISVSVAFLLAIAASPMPGISAQAPPKVTGPAASATPDKPHKSVYGKLDSIISSRNGVIMRTDAGERLAWKFTPAVITELAKFKVGDPMIVIYRQTSPSEKRVTAVAFPGTADKPTYINMTGEKLILRSAAFVGGVCSELPDAGSVTESIIPSDGRAEVLQDCWCCAPSNETCAPSNKAGKGQAFLVKCFQ